MWIPGRNKKTPCRQAMGWLFLYTLSSGPVFLVSREHRGLPTSTVLSADHVTVRFHSWLSRLCLSHQLVCAPNATFSQSAKHDLIACAHICKHSDGGTVVPVDHSGDQADMKQRKDVSGMKGITTSTEQVASVHVATLISPYTKYTVRIVMTRTRIIHKSVCWRFGTCH